MKSLLPVLHFISRACPSQTEYSFPSPGMKYTPPYTDAFFPPLFALTRSPERVPLFASMSPPLLIIEPYAETFYQTLVSIGKFFHSPPFCHFLPSRGTPPVFSSSRFFKGVDILGSFPRPVGPPPFFILSGLEKRA